MLIHAFSLSASHFVSCTVAHLPQEYRSHNDAQDLLLLQDYVCNLSMARVGLCCGFCGLIFGTARRSQNGTVKVLSFVLLLSCACDRKSGTAGGPIFGTGRPEGQLFFFFRATPIGSRQVVQHAVLHAAE